MDDTGVTFTEPEGPKSPPDIKPTVPPPAPASTVPTLTPIPLKPAVTRPAPSPEPPKPIPTPQVMTPAGPQSAPPSPQKKSSIRTMVSDTERTLKSDSFSASRLIAQQDAARTYAGETGRNHRIFWIATGVTVMIVVTTGGFFFWSSAVRAPASPALTPPKPAIPATLTNIAELPGPDRVAFLSAWQALSRKDLATNEFQALAPFNKNTGAFLGAHDLFSMLHVVPPPLLWDGMRGPFTLGVIHASRGNEALLVLDMRSFAETLGGMLAWEKNLPQALGDLLSQTISIDRGSNTFKDAVVANHDVRFVQNTAGETVLMYTVFNDRLLVITQSAEALDLALRQLSFFPPQ